MACEPTLDLGLRLVGRDAGLAIGAGGRAVDEVAHPRGLRSREEVR
jgi:hypothetical protein